MSLIRWTHLGFNLTATMATDYRSDIKSHGIFVGIDTGTDTGFAVWDKNRHCFLEVKTMPIHVAMLEIKALHDKYGETLYVRFEDARKRKWYNTHDAKEDRDKLQGAGSIKRDCKIWDDYLKWLGVNHEAVAPKNNKTKMSRDYFKMLTGYTGTTNEHNRDAAMLVFGI